MATKSLMLAKKLASAYPWTTSPLVVGAPMRVMAGPELAVAVSAAGGLGFIGPGIKTSDTASALDQVRGLLVSPSIPASLQTTTTSKDASFVLPVGVGFQTWNDDLKLAISAIENYKPCAAWLFAPRNGQEEFDSWTQKIREISPKTQIWIQVGTVREAVQAAKSRSAPDVLVVQGAEAGGHGRESDGIGLITLLPEVADALRETRISLVAAGGISDGRGVAAALCLGAAGIAMGTRFLAATEARISKGYQNEVVRAQDGGVSTTRTTLYNKLRGTVGWPDGFSPRTIVNKSWHEHNAGKPFEELKALHDEAMKAGDAGWGVEGRLATYAGAGVGLVHDVKDARDIVVAVRSDAGKILKELQSIQQEFLSIN
jgi:nitronate monooxygenase